MKTMKKIASLLLALAMIFALATTAFATGTNSITVKNTVINETYTIYKMLDLVVNDPANPTAFSYTVATGWNNFFTTGKGKEYVDISTAGYVTWKDGKDSDADMILFGQAAEEFAKSVTKIGEIKANSDTVSFTNLENGYYLITSSLGTKATIGTTPSNTNPEIKEKNPKDTIIKTVKEDSNGNYGASNDAQIGDTVEFKSEATLLPYTTNVKIHDTMEAGLTYNGDVKIYTDITLQTELVGGYTIQNTPDAGDTFTIQFNEEYLATLTSETKLYLKYSAVLNENAVKTTATDGTTTTVFDDQINSTKITFGNEQSVESETTTTTHKFSVFKHAKNSNDELPGAVFSLKKNGTVVPLINLDDNNYRVAKAGETGTTDTFTTVANGDIVIWGVDSDTDYTLLETKAPEGYNTLTAEVTVTVNADNSTRIDVENNSGTELPSTGGMGTTLFYVLGGILVAVAVVLLVTKKRMASNN